MNKLNNFMTVKEISNLLNVSDDTVRRIIKIIYPAKMEHRRMTKLSKSEAEKVIGEIRIEIKRGVPQNTVDLPQITAGLQQNIPGLQQNVPDVNKIDMQTFMPSYSVLKQSIIDIAGDLHTANVRLDRVEYFLENLTISINRLVDKLDENIKK